MKLSEIITALDLKIITGQEFISTKEPGIGYTSDLLSCVMAGAVRESIWVTLQAHINIVAVAALLEVSAVIITEGAEPDAPTIEKARSEGIVLLSTPHNSFFIAGKLWELGIRDR